MLKSAIRVALVSCVAAATGWVIWSCAQPRLQAVADVADPARRGRPWALDDVVSSAIALVAVGTYAILMATAVVAVGSCLAAPRRAAHLAGRGWAGPRWWRRAVLTACGLGVAMHIASAEAAVGPDRPPCAAACAPSLDGLPYPDLPTAPWPRRLVAVADLATATPPRGRLPESILVVRAGDSLWSIATALSPAGTGDRAVAAMVARLYEANRSVIGDDPDLIYPGTLLRSPGGRS
jgi:hypothetical protein